MSRRFKFFSTSLFFYSIFCVNPSFTQTSVAKDFYLVDSLPLNWLTQNEQKILDSCLTVYHQAKHDTDRVIILEEIFGRLMLDDVKEYSFIQLRLLKKIFQEKSASVKSLERAFARSFLNIGYKYDSKGSSNKALSFYQKALTLFRKNNEEKDIAICLSLIAYKNMVKGNRLEGLLSYKESLEISIKIKEYDNLASIAISIANSYKNLGKTKKAIKCLELVLTLSNKDIHKSITAAALNEIGVIYYELKRFDEALNYLKKSLLLEKEIKNQMGICRPLDVIGEIYRAQDNFSGALELFGKSLQIRRQMNYKYGTTASLINIGNVHAELNNFNKANKFYVEALKTCQEIDNKLGIASCLNNIGKTYLKQKEFGLAASYCSKSLDLTKDLNYTRGILSSTKLLSLIYEEQNKHKQALNLHRIYTHLKDSIKGAETQRALTSLENKLILTKKIQQIKLLKKEKQLKEAKFKISLFLYGLLLFLLAGITFFWIKGKKSRYEKELHNLRQALIEKKEKESTGLLISIPVCIGKKIFSVKVEDVLYFKAESKYVFLTIKEGKSFIADFTLAELEQKLPPHFIRIHRSIIINVQHISLLKKASRRRVVVTMNDENSTSFTSSEGYAYQTEKLVKEHQPYSL